MLFALSAKINMTFISVESHDAYLFSLHSNWVRSLLRFFLGKVLRMKNTYLLRGFEISKVHRNGDKETVTIAADVQNKNVDSCTKWKMKSYNSMSHY